MPDDSADDLLDKLSRGEVEAAGDLFATYAPYLRALVRRQISDRLRTKFDSADVVQSVWVQVVRQLGQDGWTVEDETRLRALLAIIARRRLLTRVRRFTNDPTAEGAVEAEAPDHSPRPSEVVQADDLWDRMLALCPPDHHAILHLRREGLQLTEIAARTGLHEGSVRRILRRLARELALEEEPLSAPEVAG
jgi:RNA polymerase sigma factor (sigma-70 family)